MSSILSTQFSKEHTVAESIARQAGVIMKKYFFTNDQEVTRKDDGTALTIADTLVNSMVIEELPKHFDDGIIGEEESNAEYGMGRRWFCDPIDGTTAFVWGVPTAMFSLGLVLDGTPVFGLTYDPFLDLMYWGATGEGSFCNGRRLAVSDHGLSGHFVATKTNIAKLMDNLELPRKLLQLKSKLAPIGGAVYKSCLVARGKMVGSIEKDIGAHDMAAVQVIVQEAGGKVTGFDGKPLDYSRPFNAAVVSNGLVHDQLVELLN